MNLFFIIKSTLSQDQIDCALSEFYACSRGEKTWPLWMGKDLRLFEQDIEFLK